MWPEHRGFLHGEINHLSIFELYHKNEEVEKTFEINSPDSVDFDKIPVAIYCFKEETKTPYKIMDITHNGNSMILFDKKWMMKIIV